MTSLTLDESAFELKPKKKRRLGPSATLDGALAIAGFLCKEAVPKGFYDEQNSQRAAAMWRESLGVFAELVARERVSFSDEFPGEPPREAVVVGTEERGPTLLVRPGIEAHVLKADDDLRRTTSSAVALAENRAADDLRRRVAEAMWALTQKTVPKEGAAFAAAVEMMRHAVAKAAEAKAPPPAETRPLTGVSEWFEDLRQNGGTARFWGDEATRLRLAPLCLSACHDDHRLRRAPPAGETLGHLAAFRAALFLRHRHKDNPLPVLAAAYPPAQKVDHDKILVGDHIVSTSHRTVALTRKNQTGVLFRSAPVPPGRSVVSVLMDQLCAWDGEFFVLDPFLHRLASVPDENRHARAAEAALGLLLGATPPLRPAEWQRVDDMRLVWDVAFGTAGWPAFLTDGPHARVRYGPRAALQRTPLYDRGLLVYPALQPSDPDVEAIREPGLRHSLRAGNVHIEWTLHCGVWRLDVRMAFTEVSMKRRLQVRVARLRGGEYAVLFESVRGYRDSRAIGEFNALSAAFQDEAIGTEGRPGTHCSLSARCPASVVVFTDDGTQGFKETLVAMFVSE